MKLPTRTYLNKCSVGGIAAIIRVVKQVVDDIHAGDAERWLTGDALLWRVLQVLVEELHVRDGIADAVTEDLHDMLGVMSVIHAESHDAENRPAVGCDGLKRGHQPLILRGGKAGLG